MSKHDLRARPVFHHTRDAIEAHLTVVMAALAVARHLQDTTGISIKRIIRTLKPLQETPTTPSAASSTPDASKTIRQQPPKPDHPLKHEAPPNFRYGKFDTN